MGARASKYGWGEPPRNNTRQSIEPRISRGNDNNISIQSSVIQDKN